MDILYYLTLIIWYVYVIGFSIYVTIDGVLAHREGQNVVAALRALELILCLLCLCQVTYFTFWT